MMPGSFSVGSFLLATWLVGCIVHRPEPSWSGLLAGAAVWLAMDIVRGAVWVYKDLRKAIAEASK